MVPPSGDSMEWHTLASSISEAAESGDPDPNTLSLFAILGSYSKQDVKGFNAELDKYQQRLAKEMPVETSKAALEAWFNDFEPFYHCIFLYIFVAILACVSWLVWREPLNRAAFWLVVLTLAVHSLALLTRMYLQGRPPVTNLYSSAVFIGWGCVTVAVVLEALFANGIGNVVGATLGAMTMLVAFHLGSSGDTLEMMEAVLDTNFWLATHVTIVTFGYVATLVAGFLGIAFILLGVATPWLNRDLFKGLSQMIYGILCFATLLSFTGTVLGGLWADYSWGRFWGWDPKENGAVLVVIWNALVLHARWGGIAKPRGIAILSVVGSMVVGWSWFGTNQLGVGLHAYGFNKELAQGLLIFWSVMGGFILLGLLPTQKWSSFGTQVGSTPPPRRPPRKRGEPPVFRGDKGSTAIRSTRR
jgi:ABC-type transport system involved in cytochrome c biogenesis permease subunit